MQFSGNAYVTGAGGKSKKRIAIPAVEDVLIWSFLNPYSHMIFEVFGTLFTFLAAQIQPGHTKNARACAKFTGPLE